MNEKTCVIDVGGGMRGIYAAGVFDRCLHDGVSFDVAIGVSAGSANIASFLAKQEGRNFRFYTEYSFRKHYMSAGNFLRKGSYIDLDYIYSTLSNADGEDPLDYETLNDNPTQFIVVGTNAETGAAKYFDKNDIAQDNYNTFKASSALPVVCRPYKVDGTPYYDGALGDTIPVDKALDMGCEKIVLILTKPKDIVRDPKPDEKIASILRIRHPQAAKQLEGRAARYNEGVAKTKELEEQGRALIVAPDDTCGVDTLAKSKEDLMKLYAKGYADGGAIKPFLEPSLPCL